LFIGQQSRGAYRAQGLRGYGLHGAAAIHATRCLRVIVHGFASIESSGGFGLAEDPAETYEQLIQMYLASLPRH
jgi:Tetracyclin repressor-like, C-terminal domain